MTNREPNTRTFALTDPRDFDGSPYQAAERAVQQAGALALLLVEAIEDAEVLARNAEMERTFSTDYDLPEVAAGWPRSAQGARYATAKVRGEQIVRDLSLLRRAAAFDPNAPIDDD